MKARNRAAVAAKASAQREIRFWAVVAALIGARVALALLGVC